MTGDSMSLERLIHIFHRMHHGLMRQVMEQRGLEDRGNTAVLFTLHKHGQQDAITQREIADYIGVSPPTVAVAVKRMEAAGLVSKETDESDLRKNHITLTKKGRDVVEGILQAERDIYLRMVEGVTEEEQELLRRLYLRMIENLHASGSRGPSFLDQCHCNKEDPKQC